MARIKGDDGLIADDIGPWALEKHKYLCRYIDISRATRKKYLPPQGQGGSFLHRHASGLVNGQV